MFSEAEARGYTFVAHKATFLGTGTVIIPKCPYCSKCMCHHSLSCVGVSK